MSKPVFDTMYSRRGSHFYSDPGSQWAKDFEIQVDEKGHKTLVESGKHNIYDEIQSYAEDTKIETIMARAAAGDMEVLNARKGVYADITNQPKDLAEALNNVFKLKNEFYKLPVNIREKFDQSPEKFIQQFGSDEWNKAMGYEEAKTAEKTDFIPGTSDTLSEILTPEKEVKE